MNIQKQHWFVVSFFMVIVLLGGLTAVRHTAAIATIRRGTYVKESQLMEISTAALRSQSDGLEGETAVLSDLQTGFETAEGFTANMPCQQNGWTNFTASQTQGHISTLHPASGSQHIRISYDPAVARNTSTGCFSPNLGPQPATEQVAQADIAISDIGGADYDFVIQSPSQGLITARVKFYYLGDIWVMDDDGASGVEFVDTGANWTVGPYQEIRIEVNPGTNTITYYYNANLIYTSSLFAGSSIEQVIWMSDNWHMGDVGDFDSVSISNLQPDTPTPNFTPTPTATPNTPPPSITPVAQAFVPMVAKQIAPIITPPPTHTPTITPSPIPTMTPESGPILFVGTTNLGKAVEFDVRPDLSAITRLRLEYKVVCSGVTAEGTKEISRPAGWPITDGQFEIRTQAGGGEENVFRGEFDPAFTNVQGTWLEWLIFVNDPICSNTGTWSASR